MSPTPVTSSLLISRSKSMGSTTLVFVDTGASPHPQSYVASRLAQSNSGLCNRSFTWLCKKQSLGERCQRLTENKGEFEVPSCCWLSWRCLSVHVSIGGDLQYRIDILVEGISSKAFEILQHIHHKDITLLTSENMILMHPVHLVLGSKTRRTVNII
jgi:hypothetical protein